MGAIQDFLGKYPVKTFEKGQIILCEGEAPKSAYIVKTGIVKMYNLTAQGEEKPISLAMAYDPVPPEWLFGKFKYVIYYYEAFTACELHVVPAEEYRQFITSNPEALEQAFKYMADRYIGSLMRINALEYSKASEKIIHMLHYLCFRYGRDVKPHLVKILVPLTHQDLANFLGLTRETTGIELKKLEKQGIISYSKQSYIVRTNKLNELLDEEYDLGRTDYNPNRMIPIKRSQTK
jgi:CRP-like cAMP-binding protein